MPWVGGGGGGGGGIGNRLANFSYRLEPWLGTPPLIHFRSAGVTKLTLSERQLLDFNFRNPSVFFSFDIVRTWQRLACLPARKEILNVACETILISDLQVNCLQDWASATRRFMHIPF
jgi:hypothetical protein